MAKKTEAMVCNTTCGPTCLVFGVLGSAVAAFGLAWLVYGLGLQWQMAAVPWDLQVLWRYTLGFVVLCVAKCLKRKACQSCQ